MILEVFWLLLPAGFANMAPVFVKKLNLLNYPLDCGLKLKNKRVLGSNKTLRGLVTGVILSIIIVYLQKLLYPFTKSIALIDYTTANIFTLGFLLGFGALFGDAIASFAKRMKGISPGKSWVPFDQLDWIVGSLAFLNIIYRTDGTTIITALVLFGLLHPTINYIGYVLRIKKNKF